MYAQANPWVVSSLGTQGFWVQFKGTWTIYKARYILDLESQKDHFPPASTCLQGHTKLYKGWVMWIKTCFSPLYHNTRTRRYPIKLSVEKVRTDKRKYSFSQLVVNQWNSLPLARISGIGQISRRKVYHRLQVMISMCNFLVLKVGYF